MEVIVAEVCCTIYNWSWVYCGYWIRQGDDMAKAISSRAWFESDVVYCLLWQPECNRLEEELHLPCKNKIYRRKILLNSWGSGEWIISRQKDPHKWKSCRYADQDDTERKVRIMQRACGYELSLKEMKIPLSSEWVWRGRFVESIPFYGQL